MTPISRVKAKKCKACKAPFFPARPMQCVCSPGCAAAQVKAKKTKEAEESAKAERKQDRARREAMKSRSDWAKEAQQAFNAYIRARDHALPCISCGRHHEGQWHAGHYLSRGARPELTYHPDNCHKQCAPCNTHLSGNLVPYRLNLIARIGLERVEWLEGPHAPLKLTVEALKELRDKYRAEARELAVRVEMLAI
jgi:uncharacterized Zn finger protein (UPF0148 family)